MSKAIEVFFIPFAIMIEYPFLSLIPSFVLGVIYFNKRKKLIGITAILWFWYFIYETLNHLRITCSGECNIRIDLLLIAPMLFLLTVISLVTLFRR
jgi:hypothetical protein